MAINFVVADLREEKWPSILLLQIAGKKMAINFVAADCRKKNVRSILSSQLCEKKNENRFVLPALKTENEYLLEELMGHKHQNEEGRWSVTTPNEENADEKVLL